MYYNDDTIVYQDKKFIKATAAKCNVYSQPLQYGYTGFEGISAYNTKGGPKVFKAVEHFDRLKYPCEAIGILYPYNNHQLIENTYDLLKKNNFRGGYTRPLITCPPHMRLTKTKEDQIRLKSGEWKTYLGDNLMRVMTTSFSRPTAAAFQIKNKVSGHYVNSIVACQEATFNGYDEALLLDCNGFVAEDSGANEFIEKDGVLFTLQKQSA